MIQLIQGDSLDVMTGLNPESVDAVIADPPYSSGGRTASERSQAPSKKYEQSDNNLKRPDFPGDNLDQRSWIHWSRLWMAEACRVLKPGGYLLSFTDWRQLPSTSDALQMGGAIWRGVIVWDKGNAARAPHKGFFRHQAEYIVWGTKGAVHKATHAGPYPGVIQERVNPYEKLHMCGKPIKLMESLVQIVPAGGCVLDPFMGSGSTGMACKSKDLQFIGIEKDEHYFSVARERLGA